MPRLYTLTLKVPGRYLGKVAAAIRGNVLTSKDMERLVTSPYPMTFMLCPLDLRRAIMHHFPVEQWGRAAFVAKMESRWNTESRCHDCLAKDVDGSIVRAGTSGSVIYPEDSRGYMQINVDVHAWAAKLNLYNAEINLGAARKIYDAALARHGNGWQPWTTARLAGIRS